MTIIPYLPESRQPPRKMSAKGKFSYSNLRRSPRNKTSAKKNILLLMACQILSTFTNQCHCLHLHSQSFHLSHTISTSPFSSLPLHNISSVPSIPLHIQDFLKPFVFTSSETSCHAVMIHTDWIIHLYFLVYKLAWTHEEDSVFSTDCVSGVKNFKYMFRTYILCLWSDQSEFMVLFIVFNLWICSGFICEPCS